MVFKVGTSFRLLILLSVFMSIAEAADIHNAIINDNVKLVKTIVQNNPSAVEEIVNFERADHITIIGATALALAIFTNKPEIVKILLDAGADHSKRFTISVTNTQFQNATALHLAVSDLNIDAVDLLLKKKTDPNVVMQQGARNITPISLAIQKISKENARSIIKLLVWHDAVLPKEVSLPDGTKELFQNFLMKNDMPIEGIKCAVNCGASPDGLIKETDDNSSSFLSYAMKNYYEEEHTKDLIFFLLDKGANPNGPVKISPSEDEEGFDGSLLGYALKEDVDEEIIKALLVKGANPNAAVKVSPEVDSNEEGFEGSLLAYAIMNERDFEIIKALVEKKADVTNKFDGVPIINFALSACDIVMYKLLKEHGAQPDLKVKLDIPKLGKNSFLAFFLMKLMNEDEDEKDDFIKLLLQEDIGSQVDVHEDIKGVPILFWCIELGSPELVDMLIKAGADVNKTIEIDGEEVSPLLGAVKVHNEAIVEILLKNGAQITQSVIDLAKKEISDASDDEEKIICQRILNVLTNSLTGKLAVLQSSLKSLKEKLQALAQKLKQLKDRLMLSV